MNEPSEPLCGEERFIDGEWVRFTRHAQESLDGCNPETCEEPDHYFYELLERKP